MNKQKILKAVQSLIKRQMLKEGTGHDWYHIDRVRRVALYIAKKEKADLFVVELAALLHDVGDWKFHGGDDSIGPRIVEEILSKYTLSSDIKNHIIEIVKNMSWRGGKNPPLTTIEGRCVQDSDRLESLGALGIARVFAYGGKKGRPVHDPLLRPRTHFKTKSDYFNHKNTSINHFYEKLLLLKGRMNTKTGKQLALPRHNFLKEYLKQFYKEWRGV